ncbi:MAG: NADH-ubiquinone oxidoreductase-F iron-sulfur binding region domain-containing protein [Acidimicrobiia bacterium]
MDARVERVLPSTPFGSLADAVHAGAGEGLRAARAMTPAAIVELVGNAGLRGRGGAGFPAARKWRAVVAHEPAATPPSVVVNAAEGEPGSFKDRALVRADPYRVIEGALIAALAVGADTVVVGVRRSCTRELTRLEHAVREVTEAGWLDADDLRVQLRVVTGPDEYLFGEETALLEVIDGRHPFPRLAPPYRRGIDEVGLPGHALHRESNSAADRELASASHDTDAPPALASNAETFANVSGILAHGDGWFRELGTAESPGTILCTVSGDTNRAAVGEFPFGTPVRVIVDELGDGLRDGRTPLGVLSGVANPFLPGALLDTPATHEDLRAAGSGLGAAGFLVFDDSADPVAIAAGVAHFLAVESCGQCVPCKRDGLELAALLRDAAGARADDRTLGNLRDRLLTVTDGARCNLATQQQVVLTSLVEQFPAEFAAHVGETTAAAVAPVPIAPIDDIVDGVARLDGRQAAKQPDWTFDPVDSGQWPANRLDDPRRAED